MVPYSFLGFWWPNNILLDPSDVPMWKYFIVEIYVYFNMTHYFFNEGGFHNPRYISGILVAKLYTTRHIPCNYSKRLYCGDTLIKTHYYFNEDRFHDLGFRWSDNILHDPFNVPMSKRFHCGYIFIMTHIIQQGQNPRFISGISVAK